MPLKAICIRCLEPRAVVSLSMGEKPTFRCGLCEKEFTPVDVRAAIEIWAVQWAKILAWVETFPGEPLAERA